MRSEDLPGGYFGIGVFHPKRAVNVGTLWRSAVIYGAAFVFTIGRRYTHQASDVLGVPTRVPLLTYADFDTFMAALPYGARLVCVEMAEQATALPDFVHPCCAVYLLGAEDHGLPERVLKRGLTVQIPAPQPISFNVAVAGSLVLYDRQQKLAGQREGRVGRGTTG